jgi:hypothetical protein
MRKSFFVFPLIWLILTPALYSQTHFTFTRNTGNQATVAVPLDANPSVGDTMLVAGDEIGVFTPAGLCVGAGVWRGNENIAITIWGNNTQTQVIDGMLPGEVINYRIWRRATGIEYMNVSVEYSIGDSIYEHNGVYALSEITAEIADTTTILSPQLISPENGEEHIPLSTDFHWNSVDNSHFYHFQLTVSEEFDSLLVDVADLTDTTYSSSDMSTYTEYFWRVRAGRIDAFGPWSEIYSFTTVVGVPVIERIEPDSGVIPDTLDITFIGDNYFEGITRIEADTGLHVVSYSVLNKAELTAVVEITLEARSGENTFRLINDGPGGGESNSILFYVRALSDTTLTAPQLIMPENGDLHIPLEPTFGWHSVQNADSYNFQLSVSESFDSLIVNTSNLTDTVVTASGLATFTEYFWRVGARRADAPGPWSNIFSFTTVTGIPVIENIEPDSGALLETVEVTFTGDNYFEGITQIEADTGLMVISHVVTGRTQLVSSISIGPEARLGENSIKLINDTPGGGESNTISFYVTPITQTLSGRITDVNNNSGLNDIRVIASGEYESETRTDSTGYYEFTDILYGTVRIVITAQRHGFVFEPDSIVIDDPVVSDISGLNFTGERIFYVIIASAGENGTIIPSDTVFVQPNSDQGFIFIPDPGFTISAVILDGDTLEITRTLEFINVTDDHFIYVGFRRIGDVISDGSVDIADLTELIDYILGNVVLTGGSILSADIDTNKIVDFRDAILLRDALLNRIDPDSSLILPDDNFTDNESPSDKISAIIEARRDGLHVSLDNDVPVKGLLIVLRSVGGFETGEGPRYITDRANDMQIMTHVRDDILRILIYNWENNPLESEGGLLLGLPVTIPENGSLDLLRMTASVSVDSVILNRNVSVDASVRSIFPPTIYSLSDNYPNPFNSTTQIQYEVPELNGGDAYFLVQIFSLLGEKVKTLAKGDHAPGTYTVSWDGTNNEGHRVASGVYIYRVWNPIYHSAKKMVFVK